MRRNAQAGGRAWSLVAIAAWSFQGVRIRARRWDLERILLHVVINAARSMTSGGIVVVEMSSTHEIGRRMRRRHATATSASSEWLRHGDTSARIIPRSSASSQDDGDLSLAAVARLVQRLNGRLQLKVTRRRNTHSG
jgi:hypothetical protein